MTAEKNAAPFACFWSFAVYDVYRIGLEATGPRGDPAHHIPQNERMPFLFQPHAHYSSCILTHPPLLPSPVFSTDASHGYHAEIHVRSRHPAPYKSFSKTRPPEIYKQH